MILLLRLLKMRQMFMLNIRHCCSHEIPHTCLQICGTGIDQDLTRIFAQDSVSAYSQDAESVFAQNKELLFSRDDAKVFAQYAARDSIKI